MTTATTTWASKVWDNTAQCIQKRQKNMQPLRCCKRTGLQQVHFAGFIVWLCILCIWNVQNHSEIVWFFFPISRCLWVLNTVFWYTALRSILMVEVLHMCRLPRFVWLLFSLDGCLFLSQITEIAPRFFHLTITCENKHDFLRINDDHRLCVSISVSLAYRSICWFNV